MRLTETKWIAIERPPAAVFAVVADGASWPKWAIHNVKSISPGPDGQWLMDTPRGPGRLLIKGQPETGILDHVFIDAREGRWDVPARVVAIDGGSVFMMTLTKPDGMTDEDFEAGMKLLDEELLTLKQLVESRASSAPAPGT